MEEGRIAKIKRAATPPHHDLEHYCRDRSDWLVRGLGLDKDLPPGEQLLSLFLPFLEHLAASDRSPNTIQKHFDNRWAFSGEFILELHGDSSMKKPTGALSGMVEDAAHFSSRWRRTAAFI